MNYIDELYRQMISSQGRAPAGDAFDEVLRTGKAPTNFSSINNDDELTPMSADEVRSFYGKNPQLQRQLPEKISGSSVVPIEYPEGYKVQVPQSEIIRQNRNEAILPLMQEAKSMGQNIEALTRQTDADRNALRQAVQKMRDIDFKEYQNPEIDTLIKAQQEKILNQGPDVPERDMATELILNLGPALGGLFLGEAGALAGPAAFKQSREIYEGQRKEQIERVKLLKENSEKKLKALIEAKKSGQEAFDKTQERELKKAQYELEGGKALAQQSAQELDRTEQRLLTLNTDIARQRGQGGTDIAKMEQSKALEKNKKERAQIMSPAGKAADVAYGKDYAEFVAGGGFSRGVNQISKLEDAIERIRQPGKVSGIMGNVPKWGRNLINPESSAVQELVESAVQSGLKEVLGGQYTEREGAELLRRAYNPALSEDENLRKLSRLKNEFQMALDAKLQAAKYYEKNGTLQGFKGQIYSSAYDFLKEEKKKGLQTVPKVPVKKGQMTREEMIKFLEGK